MLSLLPLPLLPLKSLLPLLGPAAGGARAASRVPPASDGPLPSLCVHQLPNPKRCRPSFSPSPQNDQWGYAVKGPTYAGAGRPPVRLTVPNTKEPAFGTSQLWSCTVTVSSLQAGRAYRLHKFTNLAAVPATPTTPLAGAAVVTPFTATASTQQFADSFQSGTPAWFIAEGPL